ncbi:hypothetical protein NDU88_005616 [Pleurodeles waltl]|uniref:Uncharacterized protein n=1 Tax=Pleurodeles waltl TaxID=8319 RepID=A0AAV7VNV4_PLEWA|nr:hypothetical protein NDU88_005616 [Pleurodeles waltl]
MAQSSQKTGYVLIQDGAVVTEDGTEYVLIQDGAVFTLDGVRPFPRRPLMQMSPLERERVITKMAYDLTGDGCDPVGKWLLRLPVQTPDQIKEGAFQVWLRTSNLGSASPRASRCPASLPRPILRLQRSLCSPLRSRVVWAISAASARHQRSVKDGGRHLGSLAALQRSEYQPQKPVPGTKSAPAALPLDTLYLRPHCQLVCRAQAGQDLPGRGEKDGSLTERLLPYSSQAVTSA